MTTDHSPPKSYLRKFYSLMEPEQRRRAGWLILLMVIGMLLETLGVGFIVPALGVIAMPDIAQQYPAAGPVLQALGNPSRVELVVGGMLGLVIIYGVKSAFLVFLSWRQSQFAMALLANFSQRLFATYLGQSYQFHLQQNSARLVRNLTTELNVFNATAQNVLLIMGEILVIVGVMVLLFVVEPFGTATVCLFLGVASWLYISAVRGRIARWGKLRQTHEGLRIQHAQQGIGSIKEIKVLGREEDFLAQYQKHNKGYTHTLQRQIFIQQTPRMWLEFIAVCGLAMVIVVMIWAGKPIDGLLPTIGLFGAAAFRLIPSFNRCLSSFQGMRFARPVIDLLYNELVQLKLPLSLAAKGTLTFKQAITLENVCFRYEGVERQALDNISLTIAWGVSIGFVGGSGAGKSTLVDVILGILPPTSGRIKIDGVDIWSNLRGWQSQIGYVPQSIFLTDDSLRRNIAFGLADKQIDEAAVWRALRYAQLEEFIAGLPDGLDTVVGERGVRLSGGQRQRIGIARALYHDPSVLVLDEATSSLDTTTESGVMDAIRAMHGQKTILIVAHRLSTIELCDTLVRLEQGKIVQVAGSLADMQNTVGSA